MREFTIDSKEIKIIINKVMTCIDKKASVDYLRKIYFKVEDGKLYVTTSEITNYLQIVSSKISSTENFEFGIDVDDIKIITKLSNTITFSIIDDFKCLVKSGNKKITIPHYCFNKTDNKVELPTSSKTYEKIGEFKESWLHDVLINMSNYTYSTDSNVIFGCFYFNIESNRIEATDGYRVMCTNMSSQNVFANMNSKIFDKDILLHNSCISAIKKIMSSKSDKTIDMYVNDDCIKLVGDDFTLVQYRVLFAEYFKLDGVINSEYDGFSFNIDCNELLDVVKYDIDILGKNNEIPMVFHSKDNVMYSYMATSNYQLLDKLSSSNNINMQSGFAIGINPLFILESLSVIGTDKTIIYGNNSKSPIKFSGNDYTFIILPINIAYDIADTIDKCINNN